MGTLKAVIVGATFCITHSPFYCKASGGFIAIINLRCSGRQQEHIGGTVWFEALFAGPLCGASMNPARSLGPAALSGEWSHFSAYVLGPVVGALAGAFFYEFIRCHPREDREVKGCC